jgi:hypothetical protein
MVISKKNKQKLKRKFSKKKIGRGQKMTYKIVVTFELLDSHGNKLNNNQSNSHINKYLQSIFGAMIYNGNLEPYIEENDYSCLLSINNFAENDFKITFLFKNPIDESQKDDFFRLFLEGSNEYEHLFLDTEQDGNIELEQFFISNYIVVSEEFQTIELSYQALVSNSLSIEDTNEIVGDKLYEECTRGDIGLITAEYDNTKEAYRIFRIHYNIQTKIKERVKYMPEKAINYINLISSNKLILAQVKVEETRQENTYWVQLLIFCDNLDINKDQIVDLTNTYKFFLEYYDEDTFVDGINSITPENFLLNESLEIIDFLTYKEFLDLTDELDYKVYTIRLILEFEASEVPELEFIKQKYREWIDTDEFIESGHLTIFPITFKLTYK